MRTKVEQNEISKEYPLFKYFYEHCGIFEKLENFKFKSELFHWNTWKIIPATVYHSLNSRQELNI